MSTPIPVEINNIDEEEKFEISASEFELFKSMTAGITEQNRLVLDQNNQTQMAVKAILDGYIDIQTTLQGLISALSDLKIIVNVPQQPAPVVNFKPPEKKRKVTIDIKRGKDHSMTGATGTVE